MTCARGVIVVHAFGQYREAQFLDDPVVIDTLIAAGHSWRMMDAVLLATDPSPGPLPTGAVRE